ncbi:MAG: hypothetical protein R3E87_16010 [Burkholderiaceae bacterium]
MNELLDTQTRVSYVVRIATANRAELELLCIQAGLEHRRQPTATLRTALRQRMLSAPVRWPSTDLATADGARSQVWAGDSAG